MGSALPGNIVIPYPPVCPPAATAVNIYADSPLVLNNSNSPHNTEYTIPSGKVFRLQRVTIGAEKDPSEKGTMVELIYDAGSEKVVARFFADQRTDVFQFADVGVARDGTELVGNGTNKLIVRRTRLSSTSQRVDVHVQAFAE